MQILPNAFSFLLLDCTVFNSCKHITQTNMDSITTHGMCESLIAKPWAQYGQATSIIIIGGGGPWWSRKNEKAHWKIKSQHLVLCDANINKGKGDEEILSSTIIWKLLFSAWSRSQGMPSKGLRSKSLYFPPRCTARKTVCPEWHKIVTQNHNRKPKLSATPPACVCGALSKIWLHVGDALGRGGRHPNFSMLVKRALCSLTKPGLLPIRLSLPTVCYAGTAASLVKDTECWSRSQIKGI